MKIFLITATFLTITTTTYAQHSLEKLWESDTTLAVPESVLFHEGGLYVSLIDGQPWTADGKGAIARLDHNGKILDATWVTGLNAPKGMGLWLGKLYVADLSEVVVINTSDGKVAGRIPIEGATNLNDITIDEDGTVYVSDSQQGKVHRIKYEDGGAELYLGGLKGVNGLKAMGQELYILTANDVLKASLAKEFTTLATLETGGDGIEPIGNGDFIISCWPGLMYYLDKDGKLTTLMDTREQKINTADIGYNPSEKIVYVPTFFKKSVVAYKVR